MSIMEDFKPGSIIEMPEGYSVEYAPKDFITWKESDDHWLSVDAFLGLHKVAMIRTFENTAAVVWWMHECFLDGHDEFVTHDADDVETAKAEIEVYLRRWVAEANLFMPPMFVYRKPKCVCPNCDDSAPDMGEWS